jgi:alpha-tubulin suppressor-like RCC1 family protein
MEGMQRRLLTLLVAVSSTLLLATTAFGEVERWGSYGAADTQQLPTAVTNLENVVAIHAANSASYVLESNGTVWAFGEGAVGQLGDGLHEASRETAVRVHFPAGVKIVAIGEAESEGFAIDSTGQGWAWGQGGEGSLCLGEKAMNRTTPTKVPGITDATAVQGGAHHVLWLLKGGTLDACGSNTQGELGVATSVRKSTSPLPVPGLSGVVEISAGQLTSCARTSAGAVYDWGGDAHGQVGNGVEETSVFEPFHVTLPGRASAISCGGNKAIDGHTLAIVEGIVYGWGEDSYGQLGDDSTANKLLPARATETHSLGLVAVVASGACSLGLTATGDVYAWGSNEGDALGTAEDLRMSVIPLLVDTGAHEISGTAYNSLVR